MPTPTTDKITQAAMETIYLCKFRVSMDGEWLCLRELDDISLTPDPEPTHEARVKERTVAMWTQPSLCKYALQQSRIGLTVYFVFAKNRLVCQSVFKFTRRGGCTS
ncbi:UNVERIFIED_CONTAM: hypothetical protein K2H54_016614 [Gekko kuhli]